MSARHQIVAQTAKEALNNAASNQRSLNLGCATLDGELASIEFSICGPANSIIAGYLHNL
jgi:hypothetical protein